jgi:hypothetical protein
MTSLAHRTPARVLRFALRCGDDELAALLLRAMKRKHSAYGSELASLTYERLSRAIGLD